MCVIVTQKGEPVEHSYNPSSRRIVSPGLAWAIQQVLDLNCIKRPSLRKNKEEKGGEERRREKRKERMRKRRRRKALQAVQSFGVGG